MKMQLAQNNFFTGYADMVSYLEVSATISFILIQRKKMSLFPCFYDINGLLWLYYAF